MAVTLGEITDVNRDAVQALRVAAEQERFVGSVAGALNVEPQPPEIIGPWLLWKLLIDERYQGRGYGREVVRQVAELVRAQAATELLQPHPKSTRIADSAILPTPEG